MPTQHARKKAIRSAQSDYGVTYTEAAAILDDPRSEAICDVLDSGEATTREEAIAVLDDPLSRIICDRCHWVLAWICPECPGCGCYSGQCTGWRHTELAGHPGDDEPAEPEECEECGADVSLGSYDECAC